MAAKAFHCLSRMRTALSAARQGRSIASIIEESLRLRGIKGQASARALVAQARKRAELDPDAALELAVEEAHAARKR